MSSITQQGQPCGAEQIEQFKAEFYRDGFLHLPDVLSQQEVAALKAGVDRVFEDERFAANRYSDYIGARLFETDEIFEDMLTREPIISLVESVLGADCHLIAQNVVRNRPGQAIDTFHVDDALMFPVGEGMERHDARLTMPVNIFGFNFPLTEIPSDEYGPTQVVPGSHYSGRHPDDAKNPVFEGREAVSILAKPGDAYAFNGQAWHRGAPNTSDTTRYLFQMAFGRRWVSQRFYPFLNYQMPQDVLDRADDRRKRVLGVHPKGAYG